jgi:tetratricopeptide (TPR) repeat protein
MDEHQLTGKRPTFRRQRMQSNANFILVLLMLVVGSMFLLKAVLTEQITSPFAPTPVPTRTINSFRMEGETHFIAGNMNSAVNSYRKAFELEPTNSEILAEMARIQVYTSAMLATDDLKRAKLEEALESIDQAVALDPDSSTAHAVRAFALDWYAYPAFAGEDWQAYLTEAEQEAVRAIQLDSRNALALAYYAEILVDQARLDQAQEYIQQALERDSSLMDVRRINALIRETLGDYSAAIDEYEAAIAINRNMTFLYIRNGALYRHLEQYDTALENYATAAIINEGLGITDPIPYLAIANTYMQMGEFFVAGRNVHSALEFDPSNPNVYATLGMVYFRSRNYEGAIEALKCAVRGCDAKESCIVRQYCDQDTPMEEIDPQVPITGLPLNDGSVVYYYTYSSALAGMHRPTGRDNYCEEAVQVVEEVRSQYASDPVIMPIVEANEELCASFGVFSDGYRSRPTPTEGPTPAEGAEPTATPAATEAPDDMMEMTEN